MFRLHPAQPVRNLCKALCLCIVLSPLTTEAEAPPPPSPPEVDTRVTHSRQAVKMYADALIGELQFALAEGGPVEAIKVCHIEAPQIARDLSAQHQWQIGRTSLRTRNPENNPDNWELAVLQNFEKEKLQGEDIKKLEYYEETAQGFRYMKAIPTKGLCLTCHGEQLTDDVKATLAEYYPQDKATGFKLGDIRGAFTILQTR